MIFLNAPIDLQQSRAYDDALSLIKDRHGPEAVTADRNLFEDMQSYNDTWKTVYHPEHVSILYLLAREDGTIGHGIYRQWKRLCKKHGVPANLLLPHGDKAAEIGEFTVSLMNESERSHKFFAVVSPLASRVGS